MSLAEGGRYVLRGEAHTSGTVVVVQGHNGARVSMTLESAQVAESVASRLRNLPDTPADPMPQAEDALTAFLPCLDNELLLDDITPQKGRRGIDVILLLEEQTDRLLEETIYKNPYWKLLLSGKPVPDSLLIGTAIENYHFLAREPLFDSPALWYAACTDVRQLFNEFYSSEFGHDRLLLSALAGAGLDAEQIARECVPLQATTSLCNALSYWAANDPLFFFATIGVLEGREGKIDSFVRACERSPLPPSFVDPIRKHAQINVNGGHGSLARVMFRRIPMVDEPTFARLSSQLPLFIELYNRFYLSIWRQYAEGRNWLRLLSRIEATQ